MGQLETMRLQKEAHMNGRRQNMIGKISLAAVMIAASATAVFAGGAAMWSYEGDTGPSQWGELTRGWGSCGKGRYQSPIDIRSGVETNLERISASIKSTPLKFGLDGPTFSVPYKSGSWLTVNGTRYELQQFHFHHPSEHTVNGKHHPMEAHLVLRSEGSTHNDAVMGVFIDGGKENPMLNQFWDQLPRSGKKQVNSVPVNIGDLLPEKKKYYMYEGSMTTPSCPQGVRWFVLEESVEASQAQIDRFIADMTQGDTNNRPIQPAYGRVILKGR